jgi:hypothetical protein
MSKEIHMLEVLKQLFENNVVSEEIKTSIEDAWNKRIQENRDQVTAQLREEFASKFEHEKASLVEAMDKLMTDRLAGEIAEFVEDRKQLAEAKAKYAKKMKSDAAMMKEFVIRQLKAELSELHEDQKIISSNFGKLEEFVVKKLTKELSEFAADKKEVVETKVKLVKEAKSQLDAVKANFIKRSAKIVEETVAKTLKSEIHQLKEDISSARSNDFGRRIFEAFASEYTHSYLNEKTEVAKLMNLVKKQNSALAEAKAAIEKKNVLVESKQKELARMQDLNARKEVISELLAPLSKDKREIMSNLLESVQTSKLRASYDKYLPAVLSDNSAPKQALVEAKEITGNKPNNNSNVAQVESNIVDIRRLAGLK